MLHYKKMYSIMNLFLGARNSSERTIGYQATDRHGYDDNNYSTPVVADSYNNGYKNGYANGYSNGYQQEKTIEIKKFQVINVMYNISGNKYYV